MNFLVTYLKIQNHHLQRWERQPGKEGTVMHAEFELNGQRFMCSDSRQFTMKFYRLFQIM